MEYDCATFPFYRRAIRAILRKYPLRFVGVFGLIISKHYLVVTINFSSNNLLRRYYFNLFLLVIFFGCTTDEQSSNLTSDDPLIGTWNNFHTDEDVSWDRDTTLIILEDGTAIFKNKRSVDTCTLICEGTWKNITSEIDDNSPSIIQYYRFDFEYCGDETCAIIEGNKPLVESLTNIFDGGWKKLGIKFNSNGWSEFTMFDSCDDNSDVNCIWTKE